MIFREELNGTVGGFPIRVGFDRGVGWSPVDETGEDGIGFELRTETVFVAFIFRRRDGAGARGIDMIPSRGVGEFPVRLVIKLAAAPGDITMPAEILRERYPILVRRYVTKPVQIAVDTGR